ncbi:MAG: sigma-54-dependent transcriptional regulator [Betaproteobacteria bacterium]
MSHPVSILLVDDDAPFRKVLSSELERHGFRVTAVETGAEAIREAAAREPEIVLLDLRLPDVDGMQVLTAIRDRSPASDVIMLTGHGSIDTAIESIRMGAFDYVAKPCPFGELEVRIQRALERQALRRRTSLLERALTPPDLGGELVSDSPEFRRVIEMVARVAPTSSTVLITGETGTGKELLAKLVHARSPRAARPFVVVECAALQETLLQSELFGHERGAFTGAERTKPGLFEVAHGGTIFLDEIGEISQATQVKLLRVLDTSTFRHLGGTAEIHVDVRVVAATNRDLAAMVRQGLFREDLYYRLRTIAIHVPPLRERRSDIARLAVHFAALFNERFGFRKTMAPATLEALQRQAWPGNVRELLHTIEAAMIVSSGPEVLPEHLPAAGRQGATPVQGSDAPLPTLAELERAHIEAVLRATDGHRGAAAKILGISERNLYRKVREYGLLT